MQFDLGVHALHKFLDPRSIHYIGTITEDGPVYTVTIKYTDAAGAEAQLMTKARQLAPQSFSYEIGDVVVIVANSFMQSYILGLASELNGVDLTTDFYLRFGKNTISGKKDGSSITVETGDGKLKIVHDDVGTKIEASGVVTITGDSINVGNATAPALNACTLCPIQGMHTSTIPTILIG